MYSEGNISYSGSSYMAYLGIVTKNADHTLMEVANWHTKLSECWISNAYGNYDGMLKTQRLDSQT